MTEARCAGYTRHGGATPTAARNVKVTLACPSWSSEAKQLQCPDELRTDITASCCAAQHGARHLVPLDRYQTHRHKRCVRCFSGQ
jgi:hypothetical protein